MNSLDLKQRVLAASIEAISELKEQFGEQGISGFVLGTDDELSTLYHTALSVEALAQAEDKDMRVWYTEWEAHGDDAAFEAISQSLNKASYAAANFEEHVETSFHALVDALMEIRQRGLLPKSAVLAVASPDHGPDLEKMASEAVLKLNDRVIYEHWLEVIG